MSKFIKAIKIMLRVLLRNLAHRFGGVLISQREYNELKLQKVNLLKEAANQYRYNLDDEGVFGLIFSFNRPVQLQALLNSYLRHVKNPAPIIVQYGAMDEKAAVVYKQVEEVFSNKNITFVKEKTCRETLLEILQKTKMPKIFFLVDDIVFIRDFDMAEFGKINPLKNIASLRMAPHLNYCYTMKVDQKPPALAESKFYKDMLTWNWGDEGMEWNYPFSVDGHLFDTAEILMMTRSAFFKAPNSYEGLLSGFRMLADDRLGLCYKEAKLFNIPCNKVQSENDNIAGENNEFSTEEFLKKWEEGFEIDIAVLDDFKNTSPHQEVEIKFVGRF